MSYPQKGDRSHAGNYRPVPPACNVCKLLEHIVYSNLMLHLDTYNTQTDNTLLEHRIVV
ncbi:predicted protein [Nematostella vectensis]|uniref:Uncharacterized protein n=1 Tax=Nematostella vectensis TaxID=45351 RepID=A7RHF8_NEMVE|nr:predicted protein [Nematostella vectensis]|eukprot:XP_001641404.1 predicted protein [Nematostella vectensis]